MVLNEQRGIGGASGPQGGARWEFREKRSNKETNKERHSGGERYDTRCLL